MLFETSKARAFSAVARNAAAKARMGRFTNLDGNGDFFKVFGNPSQIPAAFVGSWRWNWGKSWSRFTGGQGLTGHWQKQGGKEIQMDILSKERLFVSAD